MWKWFKRGSICAVVLAGFTVVWFNTELPSYARTSTRAISNAFKDSVPVEFDLQRARDMLEDLVPEMRANLRLVANEEVEVANLEKDIQREETAVTRQRGRIEKLRDMLRIEQASYTVRSRSYQRAELVDELSRGFDHLKTAEMLLKGKRDLLHNRKHSLDAALKKLEKTRVARIELASQIEAIEGQLRLVQAQSSGTGFCIDETKLAQTERLIGTLKKRLAVAQRVLARESRFVETVPVEPADSDRIFERVDAYLDSDDAKSTEKVSSF